MYIKENSAHMMTKKINVLTYKKNKKITRQLEKYAIGLIV